MAALMFVLGALNIVIALTLPFGVWAWFVSIGAIGAKIVAFLVQYAIFRNVIGRKLTGRLPDVPSSHGA